MLESDYCRIERTVFSLTSKSWVSSLESDYCRIESQQVTEQVIR